MRIRNVLGFSTLSAFIAALAIGCGEGEPQGVKVQAETPAPPDQKRAVPKEVTKGGGPGSSGNMNRNPGADPLKR
jgi:hypothetical protein